MEATVIAPVAVNGQLLVPLQSKISGSVQNVNRFGFGLKLVTASIQCCFDALQLPDGRLIPINFAMIPEIAFPVLLAWRLKSFTCWENSICS